MNKKKIYLAILWVAILAVLFLFVDINKVIETIAKVNLYYFIIAIFITLIAIIIKAWRWQRVLYHRNLPVSMIQSIKIVCSANFIFLFMPNFAGDFYRGYALKKMKNYKFVKGFASSIFEKFMDFGVILVLGILWLGTYVLVKNVAIKASIFIMMLLLFVAIILVFILMQNPKIIFKIISFLHKKGLLFKMGKTKIGNSIKKEGTAFLSELKSLSTHKKILIITSLFTFISWGLYGVRFYLLALALNIQISLVSAIGIYFLAISIGIISMTPASFGSKEAIITFLFALQGITADAGLSLALVDRVVFFIITTFFAIVFYQLNATLHFSEKKMI